MRIAVFGGTFDPPHVGHVELCRMVLNEKRYGIDKIIVMPCGNPPHRYALTESKHRFNMCKLAFRDARFAVSDYEIKEGRDRFKSYTFKTLEYIKSFNDIKPYLIVGGDSMREMRLWAKPEAIASLCEIIAVERRGIGGIEAAAAEFQKEFNAAVHISRFEIPGFSSTEIRILNSFGIDITGYTGEAVASYIKENNICRGYQFYADILRPLMGDERFVHSAYTAVTAYKLAKFYGLDAGKAVVAGLIHDCAKEVPESVLKSVYGIEIPAAAAVLHPKIRHAPLGALFAQKLFNISDSEILNAIKYHTSGKKDMEPLEKLIFIADYIEPTRGHTDTPAMYDLAFKDIDKAVEAKYAEIERKRGSV